jgi:HAMP domain-containing protein
VTDGSPLRAEFRPPGVYVAAPAGGWRLVPAPLPPRDDFLWLRPALTQTRDALAALARRAAATASPSRLADRPAAGRPSTPMPAAIGPCPSDRHSFAVWLRSTQLQLAQLGEVAGPLGEFRRSRVAIRGEDAFAGVTLFAPPARNVPRLVDELAEFACADDAMDPILRALLCNLQLVLIHPFMDGNGRLACALAESLLRRDGCLATPGLPLRRVADLNYSRVICATQDVVRWSAWGAYLRLWLSLIQEACDLTFETPTAL